MICRYCGHEVVLDHKVGREELCPECSSYLRCCRNCTLHDPAAYHECREPEADWVQDKSFGNFCDYFTPSDKPYTPDTRRDDARKKLDALFDKKPDDAPS
ncbi:hypothetical protein JW948_01210 [bacterium]|nr:hypothetical protein [bacterium]